MENKLTNEEIAKVFLLYFGADIFIYSERFASKRKKDKINETMQELHVTSKSAIVYGKLYGCDASECKLKLKPLSSITDEDAIEVRDHFLKMPSLEVKTVYPVLVQIFDINVPVGNDLLLRQFTVTELINLHSHLQNKGYATKLFFAPNHWANGKTAIELGIAIEQQ